MTTQDSEPSTEGRADPAAPAELFPLLYRELHGLAQRLLHSQAAGATLGTTTLLHEAYLNLADRKDARFPDRARFLAYASRAMRGLIIDYARRRAATKRGGEFHLLPLDDQDVPERPADAGGLEELGDALDQLGAMDPSLAELVDLHFFCGLSFVEIAALRGVSDRTVQRDWREARLILHRALRPGMAGPAGA
ncbi:MAG: ECF-type sigma factor [Gemmatimonadales bacterium]